MNERLEKLLRSFWAFSERDIENGLNCMISKSYKKDEYLIKEGSTCDWIGFLYSGVVRNYYYSNKGEEVTYCLTFPNSFITAYSSFIDDVKTFENIQALSNAEVLLLRKENYKDLIQSSRAWLEFSNHFAEQSYVLMEKRLVSLQMESAEDRYNDLVKQFPHYIQQVPLKHIASYLGVTPRHLSRLRKSPK